MKKLIYKIKGYTSEYNPATEEVEQKLCPAEVVIENPTDEEIAKAKEIAYNGEWSIDDDGQPAPGAEPTDAERIAELEEALSMLLNGVTE